jgi:O-acetyl-ADP-ribose deacetylase (regulator of RNase III)
VKGDLVTAEREALVNTVNCVGVMGRGVALAFKRRFPANFKAYKAACEWGEVELGRMFVFETGELMPRFIINFPTKQHWRGRSRLADIDSGLSVLVAEIERRGIRSIALPPLGCGLGGLEWTAVKPRIHRALAGLPDLDTLVFEPYATNSVEVPLPAPKRPAMTPGRAALLGLMHRYLIGLAEPFVTLLEVHKLLYFMQEAGEPLRLQYVKAPHGPYAENLRHVLRALDGHYLEGGGSGGDRTDEPLNLIPGAIREAEAFLGQHTETRSRFDRVVELVAGFESSFSLELLATVHWVINEIGTDATPDVVRATYGWNSRKRQFSERKIELARDTLGDRGWLKSVGG